MYRIRPILAMFACALALHATPSVSLFDDISDSQEAYKQVVGQAPLAASFSTGSSAYDLTNVVLALCWCSQSQIPAAAPLRPAGSGGRDRRSPSPANPALTGKGGPRPAIFVGSGSITVNLYSDNSTSPGSLLTQIGTLADSSLPFSTPQNFTFTLNTPYALSANTRYWIGVSSSNNSVAGWYGTISTIGTEVTTEFIDVGGTISPDGFAFLLQVNAVQLSTPSTPVPPSVTLVLTGLLGVGLYMLRRRFTGPNQAA